MSHLAQRRAELLRRCRIQRLHLHHELQPLRARAAAIDRGLRRVQAWISVPKLLVLGATMVLVLGRSRTLRFVGGALALFASARRLRRQSAALASLTR